MRRGRGMSGITCLHHPLVRWVAPAIDMPPQPDEEHISHCCQRVLGSLGFGHLQQPAHALVLNHGPHMHPVHTFRLIMHIAKHSGRFLRIDVSGLAGAGAFWSGMPDGSGCLPEPKHFWYDINEYRLNSKPHIRRILQHQQAQGDGDVQAGSEPNLAAEPIAQLPESRETVSPAQPEEHHGSSMPAASAPHQASSRQHMERDDWPSPSPPKHWQHGGRGVNTTGLGAQRCQDSDRRQPEPDDWQPVTASQLLKRQRLADPAAQPLQSDAAACQQVKQEQPSVSAHCASSSAGGADSLAPHGEQEGCGAVLNDAPDSGPLLDSKESCEDVLAMWGDAGEADQEFAWAEPPAGMGDGSVDSSSACTDRAASMPGHRTWACQVPSRPWPGTASPSTDTA